MNVGSLGLVGAVREGCTVVGLVAGVSRPIGLGGGGLSPMLQLFEL